MKKKTREEDLKKREEKLYSIRTFLHHGTSTSYLVLTLLFLYAVVEVALLKKCSRKNNESLSGKKVFSVLLFNFHFLENGRNSSYCLLWWKYWLFPTLCNFQRRFVQKSIIFVEIEENLFTLPIRSSSGHFFYSLWETSTGCSDGWDYVWSSMFNRWKGRCSSLFD